jgi:hypothetical protein
MGEKLRQKLSKMFGEDLLFMDDFDDCIMGVVERCGMETVVVYNRRKVLEKLIKYGMDEDEATDFHYNNQASAYMGDRTPVFFDALNEVLVD